MPPLEYSTLIDVALVGNFAGIGVQWFEQEQHTRNACAGVRVRSIIRRQVSTQFLSYFFVAQQLWQGRVWSFARYIGYPGKIRDNQQADHRKRERGDRRPEQATAQSQQ